MRSDKPLLHGEITSSIIDSFFEGHGDLGFGLVLHFGKKPRFHRIFFENRFKRRKK